MLAYPLEPRRKPGRVALPSSSPWLQLAAWPSPHNARSNHARLLERTCGGQSACGGIEALGWQIGSAARRCAPTPSAVEGMPACVCTGGARCSGGCDSGCKPKAGGAGGKVPEETEAVAQERKRLEQGQWFRLKKRPPDAATLDASCLHLGVRPADDPALPLTLIARSAVPAAPLSRSMKTVHRCVATPLVGCVHSCAITDTDAGACLR